MPIPDNSECVPWLCLGCRCVIAETGHDISLDNSADPHLCWECFKSFSPAELAALAIRYQQSRAIIDCADAISAICRAALNGFDFFGRHHRPGDN